MAAADLSPPTCLRLHGPAGVCRGAGEPWQPLERQHAALLAWWWLEGATPRARLAGLLWPEVGKDRARGNLRSACSSCARTPAKW